MNLFLFPHKNLASDQNLKEKMSRIIKVKPYLLQYC